MDLRKIRIIGAGVVLVIGLADNNHMRIWVDHPHLHFEVPADSVVASVASPISASGGNERLVVSVSDQTPEMQDRVHYSLA